MQKVVLGNGLTIIHQRKPGNSVVVEVMVKVGSNHELPEERGISHFLEHILFEGTTKRPTNREISNEIEKIGGDFNAYTTNERTCFYVKVLRKHFHKAVEILAEILQQPLFAKEHIEKEKNIVLKEIDMVHDEPSYYQWILLQQNLFKKAPCQFPTYGDRKVIKNLTREMVLAYFQKHYAPNNMVISIVGDVGNWKKEVTTHFTMEKRTVPRQGYPEEPIANKNQEIVEKRKNIANTYTVLGFKTVPRGHHDTYALEVLNGILGRGQSGRMFIEIRSNRGLAYEVGTQHFADVNFGFFAVYASIDRKNKKLVKQIILEEIEKIKHCTDDDLEEARTYVEGSYLLDMEDGQKIADQLLFWEQVRDVKLMDDFLKKIKKVSKQDLVRVINTYFKYHTFVVLRGK
ncbi:insulinase family protein [Candidatus Woesearchaeota archaeon]|nr:insulinase family protein [Candidatus Woesearchaeota archaeon]